MRRCADPSSVCGHVWAESSVGNRTVLEILNAEQELLNSRVQLVTARRDSYVAGFTLRAAMGRAEAKDRGLFGGSLYDPPLDYSRVSNRSSNYGPCEDPWIEDQPESRQTHQSCKSSMTDQ